MNQNEARRADEGYLANLWLLVGLVAFLVAGDTWSISHGGRAFFGLAWNVVLGVSLFGASAGKPVFYRLFRIGFGFGVIGVGVFAVWLAARRPGGGEIAWFLFSALLCGLMATMLYQINRRWGGFPEPVSQPAAGPAPEGGWGALGKPAGERDDPPAT